MLSSGYRIVIFIHSMVSGMRNAGMEKTFSAGKEFPPCHCTGRTDFRIQRIKRRFCLDNPIKI